MESEGAQEAMAKPLLECELAEACMFLAHGKHALNRHSALGGGVR